MRMVDEESRMATVIHRDTPRGLGVRLEDAGFDQLLIGCEDPEDVKRQIGELH